jgi:prefoldin subunit 5
MNAYELAKDLNIKASMINLGEKIAWGSDSGIMDEAANMLRQQADRIAELSESELNLINQNRELEKNIPHHFGLGHASGFDDASKFYKEKIAELEKQRNRLETLAEQMLRDGDDE